MTPRYVRARAEQAAFGDGLFEAAELALEDEDAARSFLEAPRGDDRAGARF